jgi:hypothetical protein
MSFPSTRPYLPISPDPDPALVTHLGTLTVVAPAFLLPSFGRALPTADVVHLHLAVARGGGALVKATFRVTFHIMKKYSHLKFLQPPGALRADIPCPADK